MDVTGRSVSRRCFLRLLAGAAPVLAVAPTYFFAPKGGWRLDALGWDNPNLTSEVVRKFLSHYQQAWGPGTRTDLDACEGDEVGVYDTRGGRARGTAVVDYVDVANKTIWFTSALPEGTKVGDFLVRKDAYVHGVGSAVPGHLGPLQGGIYRATVSVAKILPL